MIARIISLPERHSFFLFGPRQTGKSTLIQSILPKNSWSVNLLETDVYFKYLRNPSLFRKEAIYQIKEKKVRTIFVDEIQKIPLLLDEIQALIDTTKSQFIMTGSSARKLKRGGANLLGGSALQRLLAPFVYPEIKTAIRLENVLRFGSLPAIYEKEDTLKIEILQAYTDIYLKEEIQAEGVVRNLAGFARFLEMAASTFGEIVNYSNIARECALPARSVQGYYDILEDTLIGFRLPGWTRSKRKQLSSHPKFYFFDNGVVNSLNRLLKDEAGSLIRGRLFEQWIVNEIRYRIQYRQSDYELFYWRTQGGAEVDLLMVRKNKIVVAIEIKASSNIQNSHFSGLRFFKKEYPDSARYVVAETSQPYKHQGVTVVPWRLFLEETLEKILG
ncbi:MAG: DUF4143 domain-containing protein [Candidatus Peregrinibacteria bacterium]